MLSCTISFVRFAAKVLVVLITFGSLIDQMRLDSFIGFVFGFAGSIDSCICFPSHFLYLGNRSCMTICPLAHRPIVASLL